MVSRPGSEVENCRAQIGLSREDVDDSLASPIVNNNEATMVGKAKSSQTEVSRWENRRRVGNEAAHRRSRAVIDE